MGSGLEDNSIANLVQGLGVSWVRLSAYWKWIEISKGVYDWSALDSVINRGTNRNLKMFISIGATPSWANGGKADNVPPLNNTDYGDFCFAVANRYKNNSLVKAYGMWNEPDVSMFWNGTRQQYQNKILIPGSKKIHQAKSTLLVGAPELSDDWPNDQSHWGLGLLLDTAGAQIDVATVHYYMGGQPYLQWFETYLDSYVKPQRRNKPVWLTEAGHKGCPSDACTLDAQSHYYQYIFTQRSLRASWFTRIFPYRIWDPQGVCNSTDGFGLTYGASYIQKPAYRTYKDRISGLPFYDPYPECHPTCIPHEPECWPPL